MADEKLKPFHERTWLHVVAVAEHRSPGLPHLAGQLVEQGSVEFAQRRHHQPHDMGGIGLHRHGNGVATIA
ncbi:MAG: hypothetical protein MO852_02965 [Candidatus Devosia euplotis]|nr:hypothetical protein [Candidatus Devosia euplotis]